MRPLHLPGLATGRCLVMGVVNVTPDSFSDGGQWISPDRAIAHGLDMIAQGASIVDVGGESTRPGAARIDRDEELRRVIPVVEGLAAAGALVSVDTMWAETARAALGAGAPIINDVSGGRADPHMLPLAGEAGKPFVIMHWRAHSATMQNHTDYTDVVADVVAELEQQIAQIQSRRDVSWLLLLVAASRKTFLGALLADGETPRPPELRDAATAAISVLAADRGAWCVRVHDVASTADALAVSRRFHQVQPSEQEPS